jgi:hypothetical protein
MGIALRSVSSLIIISVLLFTTKAPAYADAAGSATREEFVVSSPHAATRNQDEATQEEVRDPRLPPVLPGEEVSDGDKKIKVWSSAGEVSRSTPPRPHDPSLQRDMQGRPLNVIIDSRGAARQ